MRFRLRASGLNQQLKPLRPIEPGCGVVRQNIELEGYAPARAFITRYLRRPLAAVSTSAELGVPSASSLTVANIAARGRQRTVRLESQPPGDAHAESYTQPLRFSLWDRQPPEALFNCSPKKCLYSL